VYREDIMLESPTVEENGESGIASGARKSGDFMLTPKLSGETSRSTLGVTEMYI